MRLRIYESLDQREECVMKKLSCSIIAAALVSVCTAPLAAAKPPERAAPHVSIQPRVGPMNPGAQLGLRQVQRTSSQMGFAMGREQRKVAGAGPRSFDRDPRHWTGHDRAAWHGGHAHHECRFGRCGYWWSADGYWYFYDYPVYGPPESVSEIAYDDQGNQLQAAAELPAAPLSLPVAAYGPGILVTSPPSADAPATAGAIIGGVVGGILGNALIGR